MSLDISPDCKTLAVGDEAGKMYLLHNFMEGSGKVIVQTMEHWHANSVSCLKFKSDTLLLSAGREAVIV